MLARKLFWTGGLALAYALIATVADFLVNIVALHNPAGFTPVESALLAMLIGAPATYYLIGQRMDLQRAVAERDRADAILRQKTDELTSSEERYRLLADASPDVIIRYDTVGNVEYLSPAARRYGWDPDRLDGANLAASLDPTELERNQRFLEDLAAGVPVPQGDENVWRARTPSGELAHFEGRSSAIRGQDGAVLGAVCVLRDVTERRSAAEALQQSERKLRGLFELAPVGIALTDMAGRYIEFNEAFREICGYADDELKALDYWTLTPTEYETDETAQLEMLATTGRYGPYDKEYIRKDGSRIPIRLNGLLLEGARRRDVHLVDRRGHQRAAADGSNADRSPQRRGGGHGGQVRVPLQHEPRDSHAADRRGRFRGPVEDRGVAAARCAALRGPHRDERRGAPVGG